MHKGAKATLVLQYNVAITDIFCATATSKRLKHDPYQNDRKVL